MSSGEILSLADTNSFPADPSGIVFFFQGCERCVVSLEHHFLDCLNIGMCLESVSDSESIYILEFSHICPYK